MSDQYPIHPLADIFPMMSQSEYAALVQDIREHGCREPGMLYQGKILDGRNRYRACQECGEEMNWCEVEQADEEEFDALQFVISANLHRRQLSTKQRAVVGARMATLDRGRPELNSSIDLLSQDDAAGLLGVSVASIKRAKHVLENGCHELVALVEQDRLSVSAASKFIREFEDPKDQAKIARKGPKAVKEATPKAPPKDKKPSHGMGPMAFIRETWDDLTAKDLSQLAEWIRNGGPSE